MFCDSSFVAVLVVIASKLSAVDFKDLNTCFDELLQPARRHLKVVYHQKDEM